MEQVLNYISGEWRNNADRTLDVINPATAQSLGTVGLTAAEEVDAAAPGSDIARTEIFGPVLSLMHADTIEDAIHLVNDRTYGNMACIFTSSGNAARQFRYEADAGNVGVNIGVAAPMAFFPFSGWNDSFFGDLHAQGRHGIEFYTQTKVVVERWPREWSRQF